MEFTHDISYLLDIFSYINEKKKLRFIRHLRYLMGKKNQNETMKQTRKSPSGSLFQPSRLKILKSGMSQRDGMGREVGAGFRLGTPLVDAC